jgi:hypothetical protein
MRFFTFVLRMCNDGLIELRKHFVVFMLVVLLFDFNFSTLVSIAPVEAAASAEGITINSKLHPYPVYGGAYVVGEAINNLSISISGVNISVTFYGADGHELSKKYGQPFLQVIPPSRRSGFLVLFKNAEIANYDHYKVNVLTYASANPKPIGFSILHAQATQYSNYTEITGTVENKVSTTLNNFNVFALLYDENGFLDVTDMDETLGDIKPGYGGTFDLFSRVVNDTFNVSECIITGEVSSYGVENEKIIYAAKNQNGGFNYAIPAAIIVGIVALALSLILLRKRYGKRKRRIRGKLSEGRSASSVSKHLNR